MLRKLITLSVVFGAAVATLDAVESTQVAALSPSDCFTFIYDVVTSCIGYKPSPLSIAVKLIDWMVANSFVIILGAIAAVGFCKLSGKCNKKIPEIASLGELITKGNLEIAEKFFIDALHKYAEERKQEKQSFDWYELSK